MVSTLGTTRPKRAGMYVACASYRQLRLSTLSCHASCSPQPRSFMKRGSPASRALAPHTCEPHVLYDRSTIRDCVQTRSNYTWHGIFLGSDDCMTCISMRDRRCHIGMYPDVIACTHAMLGMLYDVGNNKSMNARARASLNCVKSC